MRGFLPPLPANEMCQRFKRAEPGIKPISLMRGIVQQRGQPATATLIFAGIGRGKSSFLSPAMRLCLLIQSGPHLAQSLQFRIEVIPLAGCGCRIGSILRRNGSSNSGGRPATLSCEPDLSRISFILYFFSALWSSSRSAIERHPTVQPVMVVKPGALPESIEKKGPVSAMPVRAPGCRVNI